MDKAEIATAIDAAKDLLAGMCPSLRGGDTPAGHEEIGDRLCEVSLVEILNDGEGRLSLQGDGALLHAGAEAAQAAAVYDLHVFDTPAEARAAAGMAGRVGLSASCAVLSTGEGATLCEVPNCRGYAEGRPDDARCPVRRVGGAVIRILDARAPAAGTPGRIRLSTDFSHKEIVHWRASLRPVSADVERRRGEVVALAMADALRGARVIQATQAALERRSGAFVSICKLSSQCVKEAIDDISARTDTEFVLPPDAMVRSAISAEVSRMGRGADAVVKRIAYNLMFPGWTSAA